MAKKFRPDTVIELVADTADENVLGNTISKEIKREVYAEKKSIRQSEFYQAAATGLKPEIMFEMWAAEYQNEKALYYGARKYEIMRVYDKKDVTIEIVCAGIVGTEVRA